MTTITRIHDSRRSRYRSLRIRPETYDRLIDLRRRLEELANAAVVPAALRDTAAGRLIDRDIPLVEVVELALAALQDTMPPVITAPGSAGQRPVAETSL